MEQQEQPLRTNSITTDKAVYSSMCSLCEKTTKSAQHIFTQLAKKYRRRHDKVPLPADTTQEVSPASLCKKELYEHSPPSVV